MSVLVMLATRGRPGLLTRLLTSIQQTAPLASVALYIDEDDRSNYPASFQANVSVTTGPRVGPVASLNELVRRHPGFEAYGAATDDCTFDVPGWDRWVLQQTRSFPNQIGVLCPHLPGENRPMNFPWTTSAWIDTVGYFAYPRIFHFYWDVLLEILGDATHMAVAGPRDFVVHHEAEEPLNAQDHLREDARQFAIWCAYHRKPLIERLRRAAAWRVT